MPVIRITCPTHGATLACQDGGEDCDPSILHCLCGRTARENTVPSDDFEPAH